MIFIFMWVLQINAPKMRVFEYEPESKKSSMCTFPAKIQLLKNRFHMKNMTFQTNFTIVNKIFDKLKYRNRFMYENNMKMLIALFRTFQKSIVIYPLSSAKWSSRYDYSPINNFKFYEMHLAAVNANLFFLCRLSFNSDIDFGSSSIQFVNILCNMATIRCNCIYWT